jgi:SAM-dependent methyltransferase
MEAMEFRAGEQALREARGELYDRLAPEREKWQRRNRAYYRNIERLVRFIVPEGASVLEIGCGLGDLLAALAPSDGVGVDRSAKLVELAQARHPGLRFQVADAETLEGAQLEGRTFDYVVISDTVGALADVWSAFRSLRRVCHPGTRVIVTSYNFLWEGVLGLGQKLGLKMPIPAQNWLGKEDLVNLLELNHFEVIRKGMAQLLPLGIPVIAPFLNRYIATLPGVRHLALTEFIVARLAGGGGPIRSNQYSCSVIVPCKNERGNIDEIVARTPEMGSGTEIIFVDGNSTDGTVEAIQKHLDAKTRPCLKLIHQGDGRGKGDAVRKGFDAAAGEVLFILDADLTVAPEDLPKFYAAIAEGRGEFINGSRLAYPMEGEAMRFLNMVGNKAFGLALSAILQQRLKDTLCGTKVLFRRDYQRIARARSFFGDFDPFGDFDLIFGAAKQNLRIVELPVRYRARRYGETKISRWRNGATLLRMTALAYRKFKGAY